MKWKTEARVDSGVVFNRRLKPVEEIKRRDPYGIWRELNLPFNERRHPPLRRVPWKPRISSFRPVKEEEPIYHVASPKPCPKLPRKPAIAQPAKSLEVRRLSITCDRGGDPRPACQIKLKWRAQAKIDSGKIIKPKVTESGRRERGERPAYGSWPHLNLPFNTRERRHRPRTGGRRPEVERGQGFRPHLLSKRPAEVVYTVRRGEVQMKPAYGTWRELNLPFNSRERRHPTELVRRPRPTSPSVQLRSVPAAPQKREKRGVPVRRGEPTGEVRRMKPAYGSWPELKLPFNSRERRHRPSIPARPAPPSPAQPSPPSLHQLKHRKPFPTIKNASQLTNLF